MLCRVKEIAIFYLEKLVFKVILRDFFSSEALCFCNKMTEVLVIAVCISLSQN